MLIELIEIFQRGFNRVVLLDPAQCCHESFVTITGDANDNRLSRGIRPFWMSFLVTATSIPPAGTNGV